MSHAIETSLLRYSYDKGRDVLKGVDLHVRRGEIFGILGPSGSGKSTLQSILLGFRSDYAGSARILGHEARNFPKGIYRRIGVSFELPAAYQQLTVRENLELFASLQGGAVRQPEEVLTELDLHEHADKRVQSLSKGMKMRLNLARALLHDPEVYLLDEPTSGQDPKRARCIRDLITSLRARGKTVLLTTHNMEEADQICDRVGFLFNGRIAAAGSPSALKQSLSEPRVEVIHHEGVRQSKDTFALSGLGRNSRFLDLLARDKLVSLHSLEPSLEDVFMAIAERSS
ncbi:MAG: ABC transporter ATP-binding protein [Parvularcula sp.]|jgi:fluoroquinolone transport system ATP-binding protein|nr:ABC transporter ATP-binding protein [Parvularcula sp.]